MSQLFPIRAKINSIRQVLLEPSIVTRKLSLRSPASCTCLSGIAVAPSVVQRFRNVLWNVKKYGDQPIHSSIDEKMWRVEDSSWKEQEYCIYPVSLFWLILCVLTLWDEGVSFYVLNWRASN